MKLTKPISQNRIKVVRTFCTVLTFLGLVGCESTPQQAIQSLCQNEIAQFKARSVAARISLEPWRREKLSQDDEGLLISEEEVQSGNKKGRSLASLEEQKPEKEITQLKSYSYQPLLPKDQELWQEWSRTRLDEVQQMQDLVQGRPEYKREFQGLSLLANEIVAVHGYASSGSVQGIFRSLYSIQEETQKLEARLCQR